MSEPAMSEPAHVGVLAADVLVRHGVDTVFTLSGGHLFPFYDGCVQRGIRLVDVRHEQTAVFAAEAYAKVGRRPGVAMLTAGPGVTNGISAITTAQMTGSPLLVLGGRAGQARWGIGSLQELDHLPIVASVTKWAATSHAPEAGGGRRPSGARHRPHAAPGPGVPRRADGRGLRVGVARHGAAGPDGQHRQRRRPARPRRPGRHRRRCSPRRATRCSSPAATCGSTAPSRRWCGWRRASTCPSWSTAWRGRDPGRPPARALAGARRGAGGRRPRRRGGHPARLPAGVRALRRRPGRARRRHARSGSPPTSTWPARRPVTSPPASTGSPRPASPWAGSTTRAGWRACRPRRRGCGPPREPSSRPTTSPIKPARIFGELAKRLDRDAVVIGDGGDFVSYAGRYVDTFAPGASSTPGLRLPGHRPRLRARRRARTAGPPARPPARRRCRRLLARRLGHPGPPPDPGRRHRRQQLGLGPGEDADAQAVRLPRGGRPGRADALRRGGRRPRLPRRARGATRATSGPRSTGPSRPAGRRC